MTTDYTYERYQTCPLNFAIAVLRHLALMVFRPDGPLAPSSAIVIVIAVAVANIFNPKFRLSEQQQMWILILHFQ